MSSRTIVSLAASVIVGIACIATISTDAFAYRRGVGVGRVGVFTGVYHGGVYRGGVYRGAAVRRGVAVGVGAAAVGVPLELTELIAADTIPINRATKLLQDSPTLGNRRTYHRSGARLGYVAWSRRDATIITT